MHHGIENKIDPGPAAEGNAEAIAATPLPTAWNLALERFSQSAVVRDAFGAGMQDVFTRLKQTERAEFERVVTSLDHLWYAQVA